MRIAVSGTHCSGKSTLIDDFLAVHRDYVHEPEPYELLELYGEAMSDQPTAADFYRQLELSIETFRRYAPGARVIVERSPLDFVAYLLALGEAVELDAGAMDHIDLLVLLPLDDQIDAPESEHLALREAMNERLLELDVPGSVRTVEVRGTRRQRLAALERALTR
jgi:hypothetical protein